MTLNFSLLRSELAKWRALERSIPFWWRDDDAIEPTSQLDRLQDLAKKHNVPVHLAVIPAHARPDLGAYVSGPTFRAVVHGWSHENHAPKGQKSSEFGSARANAAQDAARGYSHLLGLFPKAVYPMFVPPWNRISPEVVRSLPAAGYRAVSTYLPRSTRFAAPGVAQINTHIDPVDWRGTRGLADPNDILGRLVQNLEQRRAGQEDTSEPLGLLTHHLMQDDQTWDFCHGLLSELLDGPISLFDIATEKDFP